MSLFTYLRGVFFKSNPMEFEPPTHLAFDVLRDQEVQATLQLYLIEFIKYNLNSGNGAAANIARAFRDHVAETCLKLNS
jgi:hypothetical protein